MSYQKETIPPYDLTLLSGVPVPTRAGRQEGDNVDSLDEGRNRTDQQPPTEGYGPGGAALAHKEGQGDYGAGYPVAKRRWYRTGRGIIAIVIIIIIIIAAITGGAVGATHHSNHKNNANGTIGGGDLSGSLHPTGNAITAGSPVSGGPNTVSDATLGIETGSVAVGTTSAVAPPNTLGPFTTRGT